MSRSSEAFARVKIDALLKDAGWNLADGTSILFEHTLPDGTRSDYVLCDRAGRPMAALEPQPLVTCASSTRAGRTTCSPPAASSPSIRLA